MQIYPKIADIFALYFYQYNQRYDKYKNLGATPLSRKFL